MIRTAIAGLFSFKEKPLEVKIIKNIVQKMKHRGKYFIWDLNKNEVYNDISSISQPADKVLIQYSFSPITQARNLSTALVYAGYPLNLDKYECSWNDSQLRGSYALARFDAHKKIVILLRDRLGIKPLYYVLDVERGIFAFASERKAIRRLGKPKRVPQGHKIIFSLNEKTLNLLPHRLLGYKKLEQSKYSENALVEHLEYLLYESIKTLGTEKTAILFSGGLDSTTLAVMARRFFKVKLFSVSFPDSRDYLFTKKVANEIDEDLTLIKLNEKDLEQLIKETIWAIEEYDPLKVSIGIPILATLKNIRKHKYFIAFAGQGADELFGGYAKYLQASNIDQLEIMMYEDILHLAEKNLERDEHIAGYAGVDLRLPYLSDNIVDFALSLPSHLKIKNGIRKYILRLLAKKVGVPHEVAFSPKKAIQYSTGTMKYLKRIAKKHQLELYNYLKMIYHKLYDV